MTQQQTNLDLAKKLLGYAVCEQQAASHLYHTADEFFDALANRAEHTMVYLKVFWKGSRFNYQWGQGYVTYNDKLSYDKFVEELASQVEFLGTENGKLTIDPSAGFENSALGYPDTYSEPMNFTFTLSVEKACELFAAIEKHHGANMVRSISLIEMFNPVHESEIDTIVEGKREEARINIVKKISTVKRGYMIHLPSVDGISVKTFRSDLGRDDENEVRKTLYTKINQLNESIHAELMNLGVFIVDGVNNEYIRFANKGDFKKRFKAAERKRIYAQAPELEHHFEATKAF
ncbi:hypothetical protein QTV49_000499 [Vibrio vulnificus]|nr:hypothetical protein [Vibrio vulnificus]